MGLVGGSEGESQWLSLYLFLQTAVKCLQCRYRASLYSLHSPHPRENLYVQLIVKKSVRVCRQCHKDTMVKEEDLSHISLHSTMSLVTPEQEGVLG